MTHSVGNPGPGLRQAHKCGGVNPHDVISTLLFFIIVSGKYRYKQTMKTLTK
jgi:hypothetical protein